MKKRRGPWADDEPDEAEEEAVPSGPLGPLPLIDGSWAAPAPAATEDPDDRRAPAEPFSPGRPRRTMRKVLERPAKASAAIIVGLVIGSVLGWGLSQEAPANEPATALDPAPGPASMEVGCLGLWCQFWSPNGADAYAWRFADGTTADGSNVTHTFATPGSHRVELMVRDDTGVRTQFRMVQVADPLLEHHEGNGPATIHPQAIGVARITFQHDGALGQVVHGERGLFLASSSGQPMDRYMRLDGPLQITSDGPWSLDIEALSGPPRPLAAAGNGSNALPAWESTGGLHLRHDGAGPYVLWAFQHDGRRIAIAAGEGPVDDTFEAPEGILFLDLFALDAWQLSETTMP